MASWEKRTTKTLIWSFQGVNKSLGLHMPKQQNFVRNDPPKKTYKKINLLQK